MCQIKNQFTSLRHWQGLAFVTAFIYFPDIYSTKNGSGLMKGIIGTASAASTIICGHVNK